MPYAKIAQHLLQTHCDQEAFDVDFLDPTISDAIADELSRLGCRVERDPHRSSLHVICPDGAPEPDPKRE